MSAFLEKEMWVGPRRVRVNSEITPLILILSTLARIRALAYKVAALAAVRTASCTKALSSYCITCGFTWRLSVPKRSTHESELSVSRVLADGRDAHRAGGQLAPGAGDACIA